MTTGREPKLTGAQRRALETLAGGDVSYVTWGTEVISGMPEGIKNRGSLWALHRAGFARTWQNRASTCWAVTPSGRAALAIPAKEDGK